MGRLFSWTELMCPASQKMKYNKRNSQQFKECLVLDKLFWVQHTKKRLSQSMEKIDQRWYCRVMKGAKYSRVGMTFIDPNQGIKCVKIDRPGISNCETIKPISLMKSISKGSHTVKPIFDLQGSYDVSNRSVSSEIKNDGQSFKQSREDRSASIGLEKVVTQVQRFLTQLDIPPLSPPRFSPSSRANTTDNIDVLNYDFSFTSPLIKS